MPAYLKIENPGICPPEGFTVLGVSLADTCSNAGVIGQFGSGCKHASAVCLRHEVAPIVFCGPLKLEFFTKPQTVDDGLASKNFSRVCVRYGGSDPVTGASKSSTEDLGFVLDYGKQDWGDVALALREFVSNAIDRSIRESGDWEGVKIEICQENQVRAKAGCTRVFVPMTDSGVLAFYNNLGKWFLHFSEPESLGKDILPKANRNLGDRRAAVIFRRGVRVREFVAAETESLFDYNLNDLTIDEARKASDWDVRHACGRALASADKSILSILFDSLLNTTRSYWEFSFDTYSLQPAYNEAFEVEQRKRENWQEAFVQVAGNSVLSDEGNVEKLERKGYTAITAPENFVRAAGRYGVAVAEKLLTADDLAGRSITEPSQAAQAAVDFAWGLIESCGLTNGKERPPVKCFTSILDGGQMTNGFYRDGVVFINSDLAAQGQVEGHQALPNRLLKVALEETSHWVTGSTDNSRDFQDFLLDLAVKMGRTACLQKSASDGT